MLGVPVRTIVAAVRRPSIRVHVLRTLPAFLRGATYARTWTNEALQSTISPEPSNCTSNPLAEYFDRHSSGNGIWKWRHYFDIYHRHLQKFIGKEVHVAEVGIFSGGSLDMWRHYFGPRCHLYGIDVEPACRAYEGPNTEIFIGDQEDRGFWRAFKQAVPRLDVLIDDGGHESEQQIVTFEELMPHIANSGVFICEDIHGTHNEFSTYIHSFSQALNEWNKLNMAELASKRSRLQDSINSVHSYPFMTVIERTPAGSAKIFAAPKHGTGWQPFL